MVSVTPALWRRGLAVAILLCSFTSLAWAIDFRRPPQQRDLPAGLQDKLTDTLSGEANPYLSAEEEKKTSGKTYVDLQQKFQYLPNYGPNGQVVVSAKLGGAEYNPVKNQPGKGTSTGRLKYLVFTYSLSNGKWVELHKPKWETQELGAEAAKKMTASAQRAEKYKEGMARLKARQEAAQKAMSQRH
jgi:hypothetical protein